MEKRNLVIAIVLSAAIYIGWMYFVQGPQMERQQAALQQQQAQMAQQQVEQQATQQPGQAAPQDAARKTLPRDEALKESPRVVIDTPRSGAYYGGTVAGPVFKRIAEAAIRHLGLPRTIAPEQPVLVASRASSHVLPVAHVQQPAVVETAAAGPDGVMPDLRGMSARAAVRALARAGMTARVAGQGRVTAQDPMAGSPLEPGISVRLWLDRDIAPPPEPAETP